MKALKNLFTVLLVLLVMFSCGSTKGYLGWIPDSQLALIKGGSNSFTLFKKKYTEKILIAKVDTIVVGSFYKGWPRNVKVLPGDRIIEVRHTRPWEYSYTYMGGGLIPGIVNEEGSIHHHYLLKFRVNKEQSYLISPKTVSYDLENPQISIKNISTNSEIEFELVEKLINNK